MFYLKKGISSLKVFYSLRYVINDRVFFRIDKRIAVIKASETNYLLKIITANIYDGVIYRLLRASPNRSYLPIACEESRQTFISSYFQKPLLNVNYKLKLDMALQCS